jgi:hypothetical protein
MTTESNPSPQTDTARADSLKRLVRSPYADFPEGVTELYDEGNPRRVKLSFNLRPQVVVEVHREKSLTCLLGERKVEGKLHGFFRLQQNEVFKSRSPTITVRTAARAGRVKGVVVGVEMLWDIEQRVRSVGDKEGNPEGLSGDDDGVCNGP